MVKAFIIFTLLSDFELIFASTNKTYKMNFKSIILFAFLTCTVLSANAQADKLFNKIKKGAGSIGTSKNSDIATGLRQALDQGVSKGADALSLKDGYLKGAYKILLPNEVQQMTSKLKQVPGFTNIENDLIEKFNRAAEDAATKAKPIFSKAITSMTITDAMNILMGSDNSATTYLESSTRTALFNEFKPVVVNSLNTSGALALWKKAAKAYNQLPLTKKMNPDMEVYVSNKALDGMFGMVASEELKIRKDPVNRTTQILKDVFSKQDKK